jgi:opacity protein-like surface antigen
MRLNFALPLVGCALAGAIAATSAAADWHSPYIYKESNGSWTNITYDDGVCYYYYSHNAYDNRTNVNKSGDCSRLAIGPDGVPTPIIAVPIPYGARIR